MTVVACFVAVPMTAFRAPRAREYLETLPVPPPATVYGMLLSAVGESDRLRHRHAELAVGLLGRARDADWPASPTSRVLRTLWRVKDAKLLPGEDQNKRPDFQEILTGVRLVVHVRPGDEEPSPPLVNRVGTAFEHPASVERYGGLSLGESTFLVDELRPLRDTDGEQARWLVLNESGELALPIWPDHVGSSRTRYGQFSLVEGDPRSAPPSAWTAIRPPG